MMQVQLLNSTYFNQKKIIRALNNTDDTFYRCDPKVQIENETYLQLTKIDQAYVLNEASVNGDFCSRRCTDIKSGSHATCQYDRDYFLCDWEKRCMNLYDCEKSVRYINVCVSPSQSTNRRYDHISIPHSGMITLNLFVIFQILFSNSVLSISKLNIF